MDSKVVHQWEVAEGKIETTPYLLADGSVLFPLNKGGYTFRPGGAHPSGTFQKISWEGKLLWDFSFYGKDFTPSYDVELRPHRRTGRADRPGDDLVSALTQDTDGVSSRSGPRRRWC